VSSGSVSVVRPSVFYKRKEYYSFIKRFCVKWANNMHYVLYMKSKNDNKNDQKKKILCLRFRDPNSRDRSWSCDGWGGGCSGSDSVWVFPLMTVMVVVAVVAVVTAMAVAVTTILTSRPSFFPKHLAFYYPLPSPFPLALRYCETIIKIDKQLY